jgi:adenylate cyclase
MPLEIERKFLVVGNAWRSPEPPGTRFRQGYLSLDPERTVRVRLAGPRGWLTIKGPGAGATRLEYEYPIPVQHAVELLECLCIQPLIEKTRYRVEHAGLVWEVDEFEADNAGLVLAEIELSDPDQSIVLPEWVGEEVTGDTRYYNASLVSNPCRAWPSA